jgi:hypothetical protein
MIEYTDTKRSPWFVVDADDKKRARLNCINHVVTTIPYKDILPPQMKLPVRADQAGYLRPPVDSQTFVPQRF